MLRPATPLSVVLFAAFALMLLSVLSTPVIEGIPLGEFRDATFGVFGYCKGGDGCSSISIGYDIGVYLTLCFRTWRPRCVVSMAPADIKV